jgi:hypothetical protein
MSGQDLVPCFPERLAGMQNVVVELHANVLSSTAGYHVVAGNLPVVGNGMSLENPYGVAGSQYSGDIVRFVNVFHQDRQVRLARGQHLFESTKTFRRHLKIQSTADCADKKVYKKSIKL